MSHLTQAQMHRCRLRDVHDFAIGRHHKDEAIQRLQQMRAQLLDGCATLHRRRGAPSFTKSCKGIEVALS